MPTVGFKSYTSGRYISAYQVCGYAAQADDTFPDIYTCTEWFKDTIKNEQLHPIQVVCLHLLVCILTRVVYATPCVTSLRTPFLGIVRNTRTCNTITKKIDNADNHMIQCYFLASSTIRTMHHATRNTVNTMRYVTHVIHVVAYYTLRYIVHLCRTYTLQDVYLSGIGVNFYKLKNYNKCTNLILYRYT